MTECVDCCTKYCIYSVFDVVCNRCSALSGAKKNHILFRQLKHNVLFLEFVVTFVFFHQVSAEPEGGSYVFQGFIQGKDYGQFGLQRLGMCLFRYNECHSQWLLFLIFHFNIFTIEVKGDDI